MKGKQMSELMKIAVVIDADNTQVSKISDVFREISTHGRIVVKRAYGNWQKEQLKNWEAEIKRLAIKAEQQFDYVTGKNATDMALVIGTMELLYTSSYDGFAIVSSDSDYTPLAIKLRESGVYVMGVGERKTPESFRNACDEFLFLENISGSQPETAPTADSKAALKTVAISAGGKKTRVSKATDADSIDTIHDLLLKAYNTYQDDNGFANLSAAGSFIKRAKPDFDCRTYGFTKLPSLLEAFPDRYKLRRSQGKGTTIITFRCLKKK